VPTRKLLTALAVPALLATLAASPAHAEPNGQGSSANTPGYVRVEGGHNFSDFKLLVGANNGSSDGRAVNRSDVNWIVNAHAMTLRANIAKRGALAHALAYVPQPTDMTATQTASYTFSTPTASEATAKYKGETVEGALWVWDGANTRKDYGVAWQWLQNPYSGKTGQLRVWKDGVWTATGLVVAPDTADHTVAMVVNPTTQVATITFDGVNLPTALQTVKHNVARSAADLTESKGYEDFGNDTTVRLQAEVVSMWTGNEGDAQGGHDDGRNDRPAYSEWRASWTSWALNAAGGTAAH
jgi:hypothetical protein